MKVVILAGGYGTRLSEETGIRPKPMVEIGGKPILWHIMKIYSHYGFNEFIVCLGYKGYMIKEYFANYFLHMADVTFDMINNTMEVHRQNAEPWKVTLVETGEGTMTGGRLKQVASYIGNSRFMMTYGDGVGNIDIAGLIKFHNDKKSKATLTAVQPFGRFGALEINADSNITSFLEKPKGDGSWINAGFFVLEPSVFEYIDSNQTTWEREPLERLANEASLSAFRHEGFWRPMDTLRDKNELERLWDSNIAPWKIWND